MYSRMQRSLLVAVICIAGTILAGQLPARAAGYPERPIHIVVPWKAGGGTDAIARAFAEGMKTVVSQPVVVDNITGGSGMTGVIRVAHAKSDGYTLLFDGSADITSTLTFKKFPVSLDDFIYVGGVYSSPTWILANNERHYKDFKDFLDKAKANPNKLTVGTASPAGAQMLMAAAIKGITSAPFRIIPYSGGKDLKKAMIGNQIDVGIIHAPVMLPEIKSGMIKVLTAGEPLDHVTDAALRDVPTLKHIGIPVEMGITRGIMVPKGTPKEIVDALSSIVEKAAKSKTFADFGQKFGFSPHWTDGSEFGARLRSELSRFKQIKAKYIDK